MIFSRILITSVLSFFFVIVLNKFQNSDDFMNDNLPMIKFNESNRTCEKCRILGNHINIRCFGIRKITSNMTCKIYYEVCEFGPCPIISKKYDQYTINFNGQIIKISREYITTLIVCILMIIISSN
ncbi:hypothetical protein Indivirus_2_84 [Indivirus ILV1]|uniref:Uncharacterized protein n=1 Tax=Indivirus ILV1 TaxID=1977633 RepID=A0A1V0SDB2_9VIRU|nr:hypothetical protein Indivirus_2_84 [Indivirus ILV1]